MAVDYSSAQMCRACESSQNLINLASDANRSLLKKLRACVDVSVEVNDPLPNQICSRCVDSLESSYRFKIKCEYTDQKLRDLIEEASKGIHEPIHVHPVAITPAAAETNLLGDVFLVSTEEQYYADSVQESFTEANVEPEAGPAEEETDLDELIVEEHLHPDDHEVQCKQEHASEDHLIEEEPVDEIYEEQHIETLEHYEADLVKDEISIIYDPNEASADHLDERSNHSENKLTKDSAYEDPEEEVEYEMDIGNDKEDDGELLNESVDYTQEYDESTAEDDDEALLDEEESESVKDEHSLDSSMHSNQSTVDSNVKSIRTFECAACHKTFTNSHDVRVHRKTHGKKQFQCEICQRWFFKRYHLKNHENVHKGLKPFDCTQCSKSYTNQGNLDRHVRVFHHQQKGHVCDVCGKSFSQSTILRQHYTVHMSDRNFECDICHKRYKTQDYLNLHKSRHLPVELRSPRQSKPKKPAKKKICTCTFCGKKTNSVALHQSHMRTHTGEKPYECAVCKKRFSFQQSLRCHSLLHTGEKPFECVECGMTFRQVGHLKGHQLTHTGQKEHSCTICFKSFAQRGNLTVHMRMHTGETPYHCQYCPKRFYDSNGLKRHTQIHVRKWDPLLKNDGDADGHERTESQIEMDALNEEYARNESEEIERETNELLMDMYISEDGAEDD